MNKADLKELYELEEKMQLIEVEIVKVAKTLTELKQTFARDRKDIWSFINDMTKGLRDGEPLKGTRLK